MKKMASKFASNKLPHLPIGTSIGSKAGGFLFLFLLSSAEHFVVAMVFFLATAIIFTLVVKFIIVKISISIGEVLVFFFIV